MSEVKTEKGWIAQDKETRWKSEPQSTRALAREVKRKWVEAGKLHAMAQQGSGNNTGHPSG